MRKNKALLEYLKLSEEEIYNFNPNIEYGKLVLSAMDFLKNKNHEAKN